MTLPPSIDWLAVGNDLICRCYLERIHGDLVVSGEATAHAHCKSFLPQVDGLPEVVPLHQEQVDVLAYADNRVQEAAICHGTNRIPS
jgi:hypothetical protein